MANIGNLSVNLGLNSKKFSAGLRSAQNSLQGFRARTAAVTKGLGGMQTRIAGLLGVAGFGAMISQSLKAGDALAKMSDRIGISTENLAAFQHLAQLNGESIEGFDKSIEKMTRSIGEAQRGLGTGKKAFEQLGISVDDFSGKSADQQFLLIADAIKNVEDKTLQASYASDIFGRSGIKLLNTLKQGSEGFEKAAKEVDELGLALSRVEAAKIESANDALLRAQQVMKGAALTATVELAPIIDHIAGGFVEASKEGGGFGDSIKTAIRKATSFVGVFADGIRGIKVVLKGVELAVTSFVAAWAKALDFIANDVVTPAINKIRSVLLSPLRDILEFASSFSDTAKSMITDLDAVGKSQGIVALTNFSDTMAARLSNKKAELQQLMLETIPSEAMSDKLDEIYEQAEEKGKAVAKSVQQTANESINTTPDQGSEQSKDSKVEEERNYLDRIAGLHTSHSKKLTAIKKSMAMKTAVMNMWTGVSEGVKLGWPMAIPAVAFALAEGAIAISSIRSAGSYEGGGYTGAGTRVGGIDGRGGMPAIVHPNEQIIDLSKASGAGGVSIDARTIIQGNVDQNSVDLLNLRDKRQIRMLRALINTPV